MLSSEFEMWHGLIPVTTSVRSGLRPDTTSEPTSVSFDTRCKGTLEERECKRQKTDESSDGWTCCPDISKWISAMPETKGCSNAIEWLSGISDNTEREEVVQWLRNIPTMHYLPGHMMWLMHDN